MAELAAFEEVVKAVMSPDDGTRKAGEAQFRRIQQHPDNWARIMLQALRGSEDPMVRGMVAVLFRTESFNLDHDEKSMWLGLSPEVQYTLRGEFIAALEHESVRSNAHKVCDLVGETYAYTYTKKLGDWPELLPVLFRWTKHPAPEIRECSLIIFSRLAAFAVKEMQPYYAVLKEIFEAGVTDVDNKVRLASVNATSMFLCSLPGEAVGERAYFEDLLPAMLEVISHALNQGDEDTAIKATQFFIDIAEVDPKFLKRHLGLIVHAMLQISTHTDLNDSTRHMALEFLVVLAEHRPQMCRGCPQYGDVLPAIFNMMVDLDDEDDWQEQEEGDAVEVRNCDFAEQSIDRLSVALGGEWIVPAAFNLIPDLLKNSNWKYRHAALIAISAIAEGSADVFQVGLDDVVAAILPHLFDPHSRVSWAACQCFGQLCIDFEGTFQDAYHAQVIPALLQVMSETGTPRTQAHAAAAMLNYVQHVDREILKPYLQPLLTRLFDMLRDGKTRVQEQALAAIAAVADASKELFEQFYDVFMPLLKQILLNAHGKDYRVLRGKSMEAVSIIGLAVGRDRFIEDAKEIMAIFMESDVSQMSADDPQIPYLISAWGRIATCLEEEFIPYLPVVMPPLLESAQIKPVFVIQETEEVEIIKPGWESVTLGDARLSLKTDSLEDKAAACRMLVSYCRDLRDGFAPYLEAVAKIMIPLLGFYYHEGCRIAAADICPFLLICTQLEVQKRALSRAYLQHLIDTMFDALLEVIHAETALEMHQPLLESLYNVTLAAGAGALNPLQLGKAVDLLKVLLFDCESRKVKRNEARGEDDYDPETEKTLTEEAMLDTIVLRMIAEVINGFLKTAPGEFYPMFVSELQDLFQDLLQPARTFQERQWSICVFDDLIEFASPDSHASLPVFRDLVLQYLMDEAPEVRQAACYGIGVFSQHAPDKIAPYIPQALEAMRQSVLPPEERSREQANASDNALSAMVKVCHYMRDLPNANDVMEFCIDQLPMHDDKLEAHYVYDVLLHLIEENNPLALGEGGIRIPKLMAVLVSALGTKFTTPELTPRIVHFVKQIQASAGDQFREMVAALPELDQGKIHHIFNG